jgi:hypothetical protein
MPITTAYVFPEKCEALTEGVSLLTSRLFSCAKIKRGKKRENTKK